MPKPWNFWVVLVVGVTLAWLSAAPPSGRPNSAPADQFSAERAMADVTDLARAPHPIGSAEHARVRDRLSGRLRALGLSVEVQEAADLRSNDDGVLGANVKNIVGVLPGTDRSLPALALMAHYDSVPSSPGAADDTSGVAAILETVRAIKARGPAARDIVVLITDGEETGLFGAISFWREHALARRIGLVVNLEARGSSGAASMFETGPQNAGSISLYAARVARPEASSLSGWVYDRMPNGTDFTIPKEAGVTGFNIAMIGTPFDYHSASSTPSNLDRGSLQHMGDQALALSDALARAKAEPARAPDVVYSEVFGRWLIAYPAWGGWVVLLAAGLLIVLAVRGGAGDDRLRPLDLLRGAGFFPFLLVFTGLGMHALQRFVPVGDDFYQSPQVAQFGLYFAAIALFGGGVAMAAFARFLHGGLRWYLVGFSLLMGLLSCLNPFGLDIVGVGLAVISAVLAALVFGRPVPAPAASVGLLLAGLVIAILLQLLAAEIAFVVAWPLLAAAAVQALLKLKAPPALSLGLAALVAVVGLGWTLRMAGFLFDGLGMTNAELLGLFAALAALIVAPFAAPAMQDRRHRLGAMVLIATSAVLAMVTAFNNPWSARTPAPSHVMHVADAVTGRSQLISVRKALDPWSRGVLTGEGGAPRLGGLPIIHADEAWLAAARPVPVQAAPAIIVTREGDRVVITIPAAGVRDLRLTLTPTVAASEATIQGRPAEGLLAKSGKAMRLRWYAAGDSLRIAFKPTGPGSVTIGWAAVRDGWPAAARPLPRRPANVMATGSSDTSVTTGETTLRW